MKILIAYDGFASADAAVEGLRGAGLPQDAETFVLCVAASPAGRFPVSETGAKDSRKAKLESAQALTESAANRIQSYFPQWQLSSEVLWGSPSDVILKTSGWWRPDLLIIGCHEFAHMDRPNMGSVSLELVHQARCSVRVTRVGVSSQAGHVRLVIGNAGSGESEAVIRAVACRSWPESTEAHVISFVEPSRNFDERERERLRSSIEESTNYLHRAGLIASGSIIDGDPRQELVREAERSNAGTIFVGAGGSRGTGRFLLGSTSTAALTKARCTVEVVR